MTSLTKDSDGPDAKRKRIAMPAYMEKVCEIWKGVIWKGVQDGVRLDEDELEERRQELLAKGTEFF